MSLPRNLDLNLLRVFDVLMEERNVTAAARRLNMSQPSCSNALERLRNALGDTLLERHGHRMVPSRLAMDFWPTVHKALIDLGAGYSDLQTFDPAALDAHFRIGMDPYASAAFGAKIAVQILNQAPNARTSILPVDVNMFGASESRLDLAIGTIWTRHSGIEQDVVIEDSFVVVARRGNAVFSSENRTDLAAYLSARHLLLSDKGIVPGNADAALRAIGDTRQTHLASPIYETLASVLTETDCVATMGRALAERFAAYRNLTMAEPPFALPGFPISIAWHRRDENGPQLTWIRDLCRKTLSSSEVGPTWVTKPKKISNPGN